MEHSKRRQTRLASSIKLPKGEVMAAADKRIEYADDTLRGLADEVLDMVSTAVPRSILAIAVLRLALKNLEIQQEICMCDHYQPIMRARIKEAREAIAADDTSDPTSP